MRPRILGTSPCLVVSDLERSLAFYCDKLGFTEPAMWGDPPTFAMGMGSRLILASIGEFPDTLPECGRRTGVGIRDDPR